VLTLKWKFDGCLSPFGSEGRNPQLGTGHWHVSTYSLGQPRETSDMIRGKITVRSHLDDVLGYINGLGAGSICQEHFAQPFVPALYGRRNNGTSQHFDREMECQWLGSKYTVSKPSVMRWAFGNTCILCRENGASHPLGNETQSLTFTTVDSHFQHWKQNY
jgi:hypothetical protein